MNGAFLLIFLPLLVELLCLFCLAMAPVAIPLRLIGLCFGVH